MLRSLLVGLAVCSLALARAQAPSAQSSLEDTVRIDRLLDSMKARTMTGRIEEALAIPPKLQALIKAVPRGNEQRPMLLREMQARKLEGIAHFYKGDYAKALHAFQEFQHFAEQLGETANIGAAYNYRSYQYREMNELGLARTASKHAVAILRTLPPGGNLANALVGLSSICVDEGQMDSAVALLHEATAIYIGTHDEQNLGPALVNLASMYEEMGLNDSALAIIEKAKPFVMASGNASNIMMVHGMGGRVLFRLKSYVAALKELTLADTLAVQMGDSESIGRIRDLEALIAARNDDPARAEALLGSGRDALVRDLGLAKVKAMTEVRLKAKQEQEKAKAAVLLERERQRKRYALVGGGLVLIIALLLTWFLLASRRNANRLRAKNAEILRAQQQVVEAEKQRETEQVRTRLARDIHDDIGSGLTKIALLGNEAKRRLRESSAELEATLDRIIGHSREVSAALSDIVWTVDPARDTSAELVAHAQGVAQRMLEHGTVAHEFRFLHNDPVHEVAPGTKHHLVMVMKEAINNALKYAGAGHITVELEAGAHRFLLQVKDDGRGFDPQSTAFSGNGLRNMRARAEAISGTLTVDSAPGQGCTVRLEGNLL